MTDSTNDTNAKARSIDPERRGQLAVATDGLTKQYGAKTAVDDLTLEIESGTVYGFLGPNGAGKTTTIRMLTSLLPPTTGTGHVAGAPITDREAVVDHIGYLPESPPIHEEFTAREQLEYHGGLRDMSPDELDVRIETLLDRFELADDADDRIVTYSKGMRKKTGLIQAILHEPDVVFLDEPTGGLDPHARRTVREVLSELAANGTTVFLSTHILPVVERIATEVGILYEGRLVEEGAPDVLVDRMESGDESTLEAVFLDVTTDPESE
ncbi:ABC transporter ATP-binding protein [Natronorubrum tibetense]|uniref:Phosphonate-transporting ATPase n=1 Tax=Natronorubrum tibetense GA33 TaxID=1114856 RepID=L9VQL0_9EURY|nr:ABC transporter ATP-binding protein [Natronorubrum tibetense]ELY39277.1 phosphonate-transporting ATPase [Natronorubrum tibetense GA33]